MYKLLIALAALFSMAGCERQPQQQAPPQLRQPSVTQGESSENANSIAGITWTVPAKWSQLPQRQMRIATYALPAAEGDTEGGECAVYYFGSGQGGDVESNVNRWIAQFESHGSPARSTREINGMKLNLVDLTGTYLAPSGPMMQSQGKKENYRLIGAIVEAPEGLVFFKAIGPAKTMAVSAGDFQALIESISPPTP